MIPSKTKIESFAKRCHMGMLGGKGLSSVNPSSANFPCITQRFLCLELHPFISPVNQTFPVFFALPDNHEYL